MILDGGAVRGAFMGGVLAEFHRQGFDYRYWDRYVGTSIGGTSSTYFVTGQIEEGMRFFTEHMPLGMVKRKWGIVPYFDQEYLEWAYRESPDALNVEILRSREQEVWMPVSNVSTGEPEFVCLNREADPALAMLRATHTPMSYPRVLPGERYFDGGFTAQPPVSFHGIDWEKDEIWYLSPYCWGHRSRPVQAALYSIAASVLRFVDLDAARLLGAMTERENGAREKLEKMAAKLQVICPEKPLPITWRSQDLAGIDETIRLGREAALKPLRSKGLLQEY